MGGLNTSLLIGMQALDATQGALDATSNNIANANTPGYTREVAQFSENAGDRGRRRCRRRRRIAGWAAKYPRRVAQPADSTADLATEQRRYAVLTLQQIQTYFSTSSGETSPAHCPRFPPASRNSPRIRPVQPRNKASCRQARILPMRSTQPRTGLPPRSRMPMAR